MPIRTQTALTTLGLSLGLLSLNAGDFSGPRDTDHAIDPAVASTSERLIGWAEAVTEYKPAGWTEDTPNGVVGASFATPNNALGAYSSSIVSLGDLNAAALSAGTAPGTITLSFGAGFSNGIGWDFAIFENGFTNPQNASQLFMELAFVEVSSNGVDFARFDSISTHTGPASGSGAFAYYDTTGIYNLAGKHASGYGTTFDLDDLLDHELVLLGLLNLDAVTHVRLVDIVGNGNETDSLGNPIYDNWPTVGSGGFDLAAIGYAYAAVPEPAHIALLAAAITLVVVGVSRRRARRIA